MTVKKNHAKKTLSVFSLVMINVIAVDNLRSLPISAEYGYSLVFFYLLAGITFFIPSALVAAELATGWPEKGGVYVWVREAFGKRLGFFVIWLQWIYNVVWYPTMLAFLAGICAYLINPKLAQDRGYMVCMILTMFWLGTFLNYFGMRVSSLVSTIGASIGTIIPMVFIAALGMIWVFEKKPEQIVMNWHTFLPHLDSYHNLAFLVAVFFGLIGMEMSAVHADEVQNPRRDYPRALLYSTIIILTTLILASLAIAIVVPHDQIQLVTGLIAAYQLFLQNFNLQWLTPLIVILVIIGGLSGIFAWIIGPTKGLLVASQDGSLPKIFSRMNKKGVPTVILFTQAVLVTILSLVFLLFPNVNSSYWILSALTSQLGLLFYIILFSAVIKLRYSKPHVERSYEIPGGKFGVWCVAGVGIIACVLVIMFGFLPPPDIVITNFYEFEMILVGGMVLFSFIPFVLYAIFERNQLDQA